MCVAHRIRAGNIICDERVMMRMSGGNITEI
jgi:hypothetical protein